MHYDVTKERVYYKKISAKSARLLVTYVTARSVNSAVCIIKEYFRKQKWLSAVVCSK